MIIETDVRQQMLAVLERRLPLADFEDWLVGNSWNMHKDSAPAAQALVSTVELALAEYSNKHLSEDELRAKLSSALRQILVDHWVVGANAPFAGPRGITTASSVRQLRQAELPALA